jgi:predicted P-loop ATPase
VTNTTTNELAAAVAEATEAAIAFKEATKAAKALKESHRREAKKAAKREAVKADRNARGIVLPPSVKTNDLGVPNDDYASCFGILEMNAEAWGMAFDVLKEQYVFRGKVPWKDHYGYELTDDIVAIIRNEFMGQFGVTYHHNDINYALESLCRSAPFNPIVDYLDDCTSRYDGVKRVRTWLRDYLGADDDDYHSAIGTLYLLGAVARTREPGTKFDTALIFEGLGGTGKSTAIEVLASEEWFSDAPIGDLRDRDAAIALQGVWLYEMGEVNDIKNGSIDEVKQFLSTKVDRYRGINAKRRVKHPRSTVFSGTTNDHAWLQDKERRLWPCRTKGDVKLEELARDRDMLWAEASIMEAEALGKIGTSRKSGKHVMLDRALWIVAGEQQADRRIVDPWEDLLREWLCDQEKTSKQHGGVFDRVHSKKIFIDLFALSVDQQDVKTAKKIAKLMQRLGWRHKGSVRIGGKVASGYVREDAWETVKAEDRAEGAVPEA